MRLLKSKKGQGTTEYVVILGIIVAIAVGVFISKLKPALNSQVDKIASSISST